MKIHCLQHVSYEGPASIAAWASARGHSFTGTRFYDRPGLPALNDIDWLVVMGGPMGVHDEEKYPWLKKEKTYIRQAIESGKTVLGICLGAQLIADALGAGVYRNAEKEIGWYPVTRVPGEGERLLSGKEGERPTVFHWHGDTFDLPGGAVLLASSEACRNQAYLYREKVLGLQFHLEMTESALKEIVDNGRAELTPGKYIQDAAEICGKRHFMDHNKKILFSLLDRLSG